MRVIRKPFAAGERVAALGTFDGVHRGHRALLRTAKAYAAEHGIPLRTCTFDRHPLEVIRPDAAPPLLTTIPEKAVQMNALDVDEMELIPFNRGEAETEPEAFLASLRRSMELKAVVAGWNYTFGRGGRGNAELLRKDGERYGYNVIIVPPETLPDGTAISSSLVRRMLEEGRAEEAERLLGYPYTVSGVIEPGKHQGSLLGYPTANVRYPARKALPAYGVYTCLAETADEIMPAVVNIGIQPTIPSGRVTIEAHMLDRDRDLYGQRVRLTILKMTRREQRFDSVEALKEQIGRDREEALRLFGMA